MSYTKIGWVGLPSTDTPIDANNLDHMDNGIKENNDMLVGNTPAGDMIVDSIRSKNMFDFSNISYDTSKVSYSISDNSITINVISTGTNRYINNNISGLVVGKTYNISVGSYTDSSTNNVAMWGIARPNGNYYLDGVEYLKNAQILQFVAEDTSAQVRIGYIYDDGELNDTLVVSNIQLEEGNTTSAYSPYQNLNGEENYSTVETKIGKWLGKPLYRKVLTGTTPTTSTDGTTAYGSITIGSGITLRNIIVNLNRTDISREHILPVITGNIQNRVDFYVENNNSVLIRNSLRDYSGMPLTVIIEYTKTTD